MDIEIKSKLSGKVIHKVIRPNSAEDARVDLVDPNNFIQCSHLRMSKGKTFRPHRHIWKAPSYDQVIAQESWVVIRGKVKVYFYDLDMELLEEYVLESGDASFTLEGGHTYEILEDGTEVYEYKTGPYEGQEKDKVFE